MDLWRFTGYKGGQTTSALTLMASSLSPCPNGAHLSLWPVSGDNYDLRVCFDLEFVDLFTDAKFYRQ